MENNLKFAITFWFITIEYRGFYEVCNTRIKYMYECFDFTSMNYRNANMNVHVKKKNN